MVRPASPRPGLAEIEPQLEAHLEHILEANADANRRHAAAILNSFSRLRPIYLWAIRHVFRAWSGLRISGLEHLPASGPYILAVNHECHLDNLFVACQLPAAIARRMLVLSKQEHYNARLTRLVARLCHGIPVDRQHHSFEVLAVCCQALRQGAVVLIHPEGTRSPDGQLLPLRQGVAILARHVQCPVVPVYIEGAHEFWPKHSLLPRRRSRISVTLGAALRPGAIAATSPRAFTEQLRHSLLTLRAATPPPAAPTAQPR